MHAIISEFTVSEIIFMVLQHWKLKNLENVMVEKNMLNLSRNTYKAATFKTDSNERLHHIQ